MEGLLVYLIKVAITQTVLWAGYWLLFRNDTFYGATRWYLLGGILSSFIIPLVRLSSLVATSTIAPSGSIVQIYNTYVPDLSMSALRQPHWWQQYSLIDYLLVIIAIGVVIAAVRFVAQYLMLQKLHVKQHSRVGVYTIIIVNEPIKPFSFGRHIYINPELHTPQELDEIILHELVHVLQRHSVDIVVAAINKCLFWWNPVAWTISRAMRNNLEYIVDAEMLKQGIDRKNYQYHLLQITQSVYSNSIANNFNLSNLKKRIKMMNKEKTHPLYRMKWLLLLPVAVIMLLAFNFKEAIAAPVVIDNPAVVTLADDNIATDTTKATTKGKVGVVKGKDGETKAVVWRNISGADQPLFVIDGKESTKEEVEKLDANLIKSFSVLKDKAATGLYGDKGKNGVVVVELKKKGEETLQEEIDVKVKDLGIKSRDKYTIGSVGDDVLFSVDGKEVAKEEFEKLDANSIKSFTVLKDKAATELYGDKGKNGVVLVELKKGGEKSSWIEIEKKVIDDKNKNTTKVGGPRHIEADFPILIPAVSGELTLNTDTTEVVVKDEMKKAARDSKKVSYKVTDTKDGKKEKAEIVVYKDGKDVKLVEADNNSKKEAAGTVIVKDTTYKVKTFYKSPAPKQNSKESQGVVVYEDVKLKEANIYNKKVDEVVIVKDTTRSGRYYKVKKDNVIIEEDTEGKAKKNKQ